MRFSINIPNFGDFADPGTVAAVATAADQWDERQHRGSDEIDRLAPLLRRIEQGPPAL